jgi:hypothetical protein
MLFHPPRSHQTPPQKLVYTVHFSRGSTPSELKKNFLVGVAAGVPRS